MYCHGCESIDSREPCFSSLTAALRRPEHDLAKVAQNRTVLVPVRIDLDADTFRIRDVFMWNMMGELDTFT